MPGRPRFLRSRHATVAGDEVEGMPYGQLNVDLSPVLKWIGCTKV
jgi:hypothetical protein